MKRIGSLTILLAVLAMPAQAQRQDRADVIIRLRGRLDLSEDQVERVKAAQEADREVRDGLRLETRGMRDRLRDEEITREEFREETESRRATEMAGMRAYRETLEGILTDEQRSQLRRLRRPGQVSRGWRARRGGRNMRPARGARTFGPPENFGPRALRRR